MPIIGYVKALPYRNTVEKMHVNSVRYMDPDYLIVTDHAYFIQLNSPVLEEDELNDDQPYVVITRLGAGLTENDFEVNVTECEEREEEFDLEPDSRYERLLKHKESYLILYYPIDIDEENEDDNDAECISEEELQRKVSAELDKGKTAEPEEESPESLQKKIDKALEDRDTEQFNALTERLNSLSNKKESGST